MLKTYNPKKITSAIFITFSGNCKQALTFYQTCFGGLLQFETFEEEIEGYTEIPIVNGSLIASEITIYGSDLVHNEGRKIGNYMAIFFKCADSQNRKELIEKLVGDKKKFFEEDHDTQKLIEVTDSFDVKWVFGI
jgi:PhnB protein